MASEVTEQETLRERAERWIDEKLVEKKYRIVWDRQTVMLKVLVGHERPQFYYCGMPIDDEELKKLSIEQGWSVQVHEGVRIIYTAEGRTEEEARERMIAMLIDRMRREMPR